MAELKEVFEMVTKQTEPDLDSWKEQEDRQRRSSRNRRMGGFAVAAVIVAIAVVAAVLSQTDGEQGPPPAGDGVPVPGFYGLYAVDVETGDPTLFVEPPADPGGTLLSDEYASEFVALSPDAARVAYVANDVDGHAQIFVMNVDGSGTDPRQLTQEPLGAEAPAWSPDGSQIAYRGSADGSWEVYVIDLEGTAPATRITTEPNDVGHPAWSPDGLILYNTDALSFQGSQIIRSVDPGSGDMNTIVEDAGLPDVSPDGDQIAFNTWSAVKVTLADIDGATDRRIIPAEGRTGFAKWSPGGDRVAFNGVRGSVYVYDLVTDQTSTVGRGDLVDWIDDQTVLVVIT